jgi:DNA-binding NarL/FixJ family response regulator
MLMDEHRVRVLVVDDFEPFRLVVLSILWDIAGLDVVSEAADGLEAVERAQELQPDLVLLDIGLPNLNGFEAARKIRQVAPKCKILFVSLQTSQDVVEHGLHVGAQGYVAKIDVPRELAAAVNAVLRGERFLSNRVAGYFPAPNPPNRFPQSASPRRHEVGFYSDEQRWAEDVTHFLRAAIQAGNSAIVVATEPHRDRVLAELLAQGLDMQTAIDEGRYIPLDATDALASFMVNGVPDPVRYVELFGDLIETAIKAAKGERRRVAAFGECVNLLWVEGNLEAAIRVEKLCNQIAEAHAVDIFCTYSPGVDVTMGDETFQRICAEHSAVCSSSV